MLDLRACTALTLRERPVIGVSLFQRSAMPDPMFRLGVAASSKSTT